MQEIAGMARKPRQRWRDAHDARGRSATARAQLFYDATQAYYDAALADRLVAIASRRSGR